MCSHLIHECEIGMYQLVIMQFMLFAKLYYRNTPRKDYMEWCHHHSLQQAADSMQDRNLVSSCHRTESCSSDAQYLGHRSGILSWGEFHGRRWINSTELSGNKTPYCCVRVGSSILELFVVFGTRPLARINQPSSVASLVLLQLLQL